MATAILINLVVNARDAMPDGGTLEIETARVELRPGEAGGYADMPSGSCARLVVRDSGRGMDRETLKRIFDPFFTTKDADSSSGLGLAVIFGIIKQHRGTIQAKSTPGQGTTITIHLPLAAAGSQIEPEPPPAMDGRVTVLLVEDEPAVREVVFRMLEKIGCRVLVAENSEKAEEVFRARREEISLLMTDVVMPKGSGRERLFQ